MKYNKFTLTNLIIFLLILCVSCISTACSNDEIQEESSAVSEASSEETTVETTSETTSKETESSEAEIKIELPVETAFDLLIRDRLITEIFICNKLCPEESKTQVGEFTVTEESPYYEFAAIENLLKSTYKSESEIEFFMSYPNVSVPSVFQKDGKTVVFNHSGSEYVDFVDIETVSIADTEEQTTKLIKAKTISGKDVEFNALLVEEQWYLEKGIYSLNPPSAFADKSPLSSVGTFSQLKGKVLVVELYLTDAESEIDQALEDAYHEKISNALNFAASQAKNFGAEIELTFERKYYHHRNIVENNSLAIEFVLQGTGFGSLKAFVEADEDIDVKQYDSYVIAVCLNKEFDNFVYVDTQTEENFAEYFSLGNNITEKEIYLSVMELLGDEIPKDEYLKSLYDFYFPENISLCEDYSASVMSAVTAYNCGVIDNLDNIYSIFFKQSEEVEDGE